MRKRKIQASEETLNKVMEKLMQTIQEDVNKSQNRGMLETDISLSFLESVVKVKSIEEVIEREDQLNKHFQGLLMMYGFESMYDMYIYAQSINLVKSKDYSKLVPVKRTITRNGKEIEVTVYENPEEEGQGTESNEPDKDSKNRRRPRRKGRRHARELPSKVISSSSNVKPKDIAQIKQAEKGMKGDKPFKEGDNYHYLVIEDEDKNIVGIVGYLEEKEYLKMDFYRTDGTVSGVATKGFFELLKLANEKKKGVKVDDYPEARPVFSGSGLKKEGNIWIIDAEALDKIMNLNNPPSR
ncbi:virion structural protein [Bacillus phage Shbh1]|uniref:Uncharacterized protein n=1 Tax=Bacillus phage Shbh1 TaxID=1796992 RepID=A0A142F1C1_9CAUD|nr:virion structural protein [Bacillus phage Shbh1]AMQ66578.1 hypothetical protein [Bacillus phage Shbh1]